MSQPNGQVPAVSRRVVVGTAGHIDHGKTSLVLALTGIDCDRWAEEKARGITIDLGFAHWVEGDLQLGFVDVPGHERFVHNALAGLGGIRVLLLVVAADEGVKPQTREHVAICSLLGIPAALVALTKADLVGEDLLELAALEVDELLASTPFAGAEIVPVSNLTGQGLPELRAKLLELASRQAVPEDDDRPARLPVDRAFQLRGLGLVVTGTLVSGSIAPGDELEMLPRGGTVRVRDVQVHGASRERALAGERTSLRLAGSDLETMHRGVELATPSTLQPTRTLAAELTLLADAPAVGPGFLPIRLHLFASEAIGKARPLGVERVAPGETALFEIRLRDAVVATRGDRIVLRRPSPSTTLAGGRVLDPDWHRPRGNRLPAVLERLRGDRQALLELWTERAHEQGLTAEDAARSLGERPATLTAALDELVERRRLLPTPLGVSPRRWIAPTTYQRITERAVQLLKQVFQRDRLSDGLPKAELLARLFGARATPLAEVFLGWLVAEKRIAIDGGKVTLPGRSAQLTQEESGLTQSALARFEAGGLTPSSPGEVAEALRAKPQILDGVLRHLVQQGRLVRLPSGLILSAKAVAQLRADLLATGWERFNVAQFKDRFGLSRKWAIPLLEHLDSIGATKRAGDDRLVVR